MTLTRFLAVLRARWGMAMLVLLATVGTAGAALWTLPPRYEAVATLLLDPSRPDPLAPPGWQGPRPGFMSTQIDIVRSPRVATEVAQRLAPARLDGLRERWLAAGEPHGAFEPWLVTQLLAMLEVRPARDSSVLTLAAQASDPVLAAEVANAFALATIDVQRVLRVDPASQTRDFFQEQAEQARARVAQAQGRLSAFQRRRGAVAGDERVDIETARLNDLSARMTSLQAELAASGSRGERSDGPDADRLQDVLNHPLLATVRTELARAEAQQRELQSRLGERHPQVAQAQAQVQALLQRLEVETQRVAGGVGLAHSIQQQQRERLQAALQVQREQVMTLRAARDESAVLLREAEHAQRAYDATLARLTQAGLEARSQHVNAEVLAAAVAPATPVWPRPLMHAGMAGGLGVALALMAVVLLEKLDPRARTAASTSALTGLPLLGVVPGAPGRGGFRPRRAPLVRQGWRLRLAAPRLTPPFDGGSGR